MSFKRFGSDPTPYDRARRKAKAMKDYELADGFPWPADDSQWARAMRDEARARGLCLEGSRNETADRR